MPQITANQNTTLKGKILDSDKLKPEEAIAIEKGRSLWVEDIDADQNGHFLVKLTFQGWKQGYVFGEHWTLNGSPLPSSEVSKIKQSDKKITKTLLNVPFCAQNDNEPWYSDGAHGNTQCNATSHTMLLLYLIKDFAANSKANGFVEPESYFKSKLQAHGCDRGDHDCFTRVLKAEFDIDSEWRTDLTRLDLQRSIDAGTPMVLGLEYSYAGHITLAVGYDAKGAYINDSYGQRSGAASWYSFINPGWGNQTGKNEFYSWNLMDQVWLCGAGGWGRRIKSINGKPTGL